MYHDPPDLSAYAKRGDPPWQEWPGRIRDRHDVMDLHGNSKKKERTPEGGKDENVFDIQQGVAIGLFVKRANGVDAPARVFHANLWGERETGSDGGKYRWLAANDVDTTKWLELTPKSPHYLFIPRDDALAEEYEAGWSVTDIFPTNSVGIVTARDKLTIQWTREEMKQVASNFAELSEDSARTQYELRNDVRDWKVALAQADVRSHADTDNQIRPILYRPFDKRYTYYTGQTRGFICMPRERVMRHMLAGPNVGLATTRGTEIAGTWEHAFVSKSLIQHHTVSLKSSATWPSPFPGSGSPKASSII